MVEPVVQRVGARVLDVAGALPANVDTDNLVVSGETRDDAFQGFRAEGTLVPVRGREGGRERILVDGKVELRREEGFVFPGLAGNLLSQFAFLDEGYFVQDRGSVVACVRRVQSNLLPDFVYEVVGDSDKDDLLDEFVRLQDFQHPASATQDSSEPWRLHVGMVVENHKRERLLDHVCPDLAHVVVIAAIDEVDRARVGNARIGDLPAYGSDRVVVAVAVCSRDSGAV